MPTEDPSTLALPDRSDHVPGARRHAQFFPELDIGATEGRFDDGRPMRVEAWYDLDCDVVCRTWFFPRAGIEHWQHDDHAGYLEAHGVYAASDSKSCLEASNFVDASGAPLWRVTVATAAP